MDTTQIFDIIVGHAREVIPALATHQFEFNDALRDLGANSIDRSEISIMTLDTLSLRMPLLELAKANNIGELVEILHGQLRKT